MQIAVKSGGRGSGTTGPQPWLMELVLAAWIVVSILILCFLMLPVAKPGHNAKARSQALIEGYVANSPGRNIVLVIAVTIGCDFRHRPL